MSAVILGRRSLSGLPRFCNQTLTDHPERVARPLLLRVVQWCAQHVLARSLIGLVALLAALLAAERVGSARKTCRRPTRACSARSTLLDASPATVQLRGVLDSNRVAIRFVPMAPGLYARYSVARHTIEIDDRWMDDDHDHAGRGDRPRGDARPGRRERLPGQRRRERVHRLRGSRVPHVGAVLDRPVRSDGKPDPQNDLDRQLNSVADRQQRDPLGLEDLVRQTYPAVLPLKQ